jgi:glycosyltransferase involved in cell wall biosynthesis
VTRTDQDVVTPRPPAVAVIMPVHNGERFVGGAVDSILAQTFTDFCLVAIDDASTDRTAQILSRYTDPRVLVIRSASRVGPAAARNMGLERVESEYVAFFDSDDVAAPRRLETQIAWLAAHPETGFLTAHVRLIDEQGIATGAIWGYDGDRELIASSLLFRNPLPTSTVMVRRAILADERFDPTLAIASDYDMWVRLADRAAIACLPDTLVHYRDHAGNLSHTHRASAETCLERIVLKRLARLRIEPSAAELRLHRRLGARQLEGSDEFLRGAAAWLVRLDAANEVTPLFPRSAFRRVLAGEWLSICETAARERGFLAWRQMLATPFGAQLVRETSAWPRLARIPWRSVKTSVRRRWPRRADASRASH